MNILMMTNTYTPVVGGVEESIHAFTKEFRKRGHKVLIVAPEFEGMPKNETEVIRIPAIQKFNRSDFSVNLPIPGLLARLMKSFEPDVVHSHHPFLVGDMALRLSGQYDIPLIFTYHTMFEDYLHYLPFHSERIKRFVIELSVGYANMTDHVIVPSQSVYDILIDRGVDVSMDVIPTGVDIHRFTHGNGRKVRKKFGIPKDAFVIGYLGRLRPEKNLEFLSEAVVKVLQAEANVHFLVVGKGSLDNEIKKIFDKNGLGDRLHLTGLMHGPGVIDAYHAMNVFAFASYTETQGLVLAEALAAGLMVVAVDAPGAREVIVNGKNGWLVPLHDQKSFVEALLASVHCGLEERKEYEKEARKSAANYSIERLAQRVLGIYQSAQSKNYMLSEEKHGAWSNIMHRIKTEWDMAKNIVDASEAAFHLEEPSLNNQHDKSWMIKVRRWLSRKEWAAWLLSLERSNDTEAHPGLVMIQIDGFSRKQLMRALHYGKMPFLQSLLNRQHYVLHSLYPGLPTSTPSVQGELFYGIKQIVPAFAFYDKNRNEISCMYIREAATAVERKLVKARSADDKGDNQALLLGGSSYSNVYAGGAEETHFCAVKIGWDMFWKGVNPFKLVLLFVTHLYDFLRMIVLVALETIIAVLDFAHGMAMKESLRKELKFIPTRSFICILLRELVVLGARMDIARGLPIIHMNFLGYDEQAHRRGPSSRFAHRPLKGIDQAIAKIYRQAIHATRRNYDVWIYSDHGQEENMSYARTYGKTVKRAITEVYEEFCKENGAGDKDACDQAEENESQGVQLQRARYLGGWFVRGLLSIAGISYGDDDAQKSPEKNKILVTAIGPTGNIYLPKTLSQQERDQLAEMIVKKAHVPVVMAPEEEGRVCGWNDEGKFSLPEDAQKVIGADHPYLEEVTRDLIKMCHHPQGGEFTFMGWRPGEKPMTFPVEHGAHAGPGTQETDAFALLPSDSIPLIDAPSFLHVQDLREAALKALGRLKVEEPILSTFAESFEPSRDFEKTRTLRVMTYNVHSCIGVDGKISPQRIARVIGRHQPDIVALQELDLMKARTGGMDQPHIIAKELEMIYHFHSNIRIEKEHYGSAILSRYPIRLIKAGKLPGLTQDPCLEPRGAIWCAVNLGRFELQFMNTHLGLRRAERFRQVKALCGAQWLGHPGCKHPVIFCGDFNALPGSHVCSVIRRTLRDAQMEKEGHLPRATWFSHLPMGRIDHVFVSPGIEVVRVDVSRTDLEKKASDHLPLIVDVRFSEAD